MDLHSQRKRASGELPEGALVQEGPRQLSHWDVVLAYNLESPLRFRQDYWWLEVFAEDPLAARWVAWDWVRSSGSERFECTDWVRPASHHLEKTRIPGERFYLPIHWSVPLPGGWSPGTPVRHPASGRRLGFVVPGKLPRLDPVPDGEFYLLRHLPASGATAVGLLPIVEDVHRARLNQEKAEGDHNPGELLSD